MRSPHTPEKSSPHSLQLEKACVQQQRPNVAMKVKVAQSCPTLRDPMDYTVHGLLQARILGG